MTDTTGRFGDFAVALPPNRTGESPCNNGHHCLHIGTAGLFCCKCWKTDTQIKVESQRRSSHENNR